MLGLWFYQPLQLFGITFVVFFANDYIFSGQSFDPISIFKNSQIFEISGSPFYLLLRIHWMLWLPVMGALLILCSIAIIERIDGIERELVIAQENRRWNSAFAKLEKISKAIGSNEKRKEATKTSETPPKETAKSTNKPLSGTSWFHSISFNIHIL